MTLFSHYERKAAIGIILLPSIALFSLESIIKLRKGKRINSDFITTATELSEDIRREHFRVTTGYIHVNIVVLHKAKHNIDKTDLILNTLDVRILNGNNLLNLIKENVISFALIGSQAADMLAEFKGITILNVLVIIKSKADNTLINYSD